ncbi:MAG: glycyl-radical enzyme activating protein, partial [Oscillospiraceae bacterium]
ACPQNAIEKIEGFGFITNYEKCHHCKKCIDDCFANARTLLGEDYTPERLVAELLKDKEYFAMSGGGVTFSGGEPLLYASFIKEVSKALKSVNIPVLIETCGFVERKNFEEVLPYVDTFFYDIKHMDTQTHEKLTGAGNELILDNLQWLCENFKGKISVRYPYIPPCNDDLPSIKKFLDYINKLKVVKEVWFLPRFGS